MASTSMDGLPFYSVFLQRDGHRFADGVVVKLCGDHPPEEREDDDRETDDENVQRGWNDHERPSTFGQWVRTMSPVRVLT